MIQWLRKKIPMLHPKTKDDNTDPNLRLAVLENALEQKRWQDTLAANMEQLKRELERDDRGPARG